MTEHSDLDVKVAINEDNPCNNINHPIINGIKLDITFNSLQQLREFTNSEIESRASFSFLQKAPLSLTWSAKIT